MQIEKYLTDRIKELKEADTKACEIRWDMLESINKRMMARELSNELTARRRELEEALKFLKG